MEIKPLVLLVLSIFLIGILSVGIVSADCTTKGGEEPSVGWDNVKKGKQDEGGYIVRETWALHQNKYNDFATDLHFKIWQKEDNIDVKGWQVKISTFTNCDSQRGDQPEPWHSKKDILRREGLEEDPDKVMKDNGRHAVNVTANGADILHCSWVKVEVKFWLTSKNTKRIYGVTWTKDGDEEKAIPSSGWFLYDPVPDPLKPGKYNHTFNMTNDDSTDHLSVSGLAFNASMNWYDNLTDVSYPSPYPNFTLAPGESWQTNISTNGPLYNGHIYFKYAINDSTTENVVSKDWVDHPIPEEVPTANPVLTAAVLGMVLILFLRKEQK